MSWFDVFARPARTDNVVMADAVMPLVMLSVFPCHYCDFVSRDSDTSYVHLMGHPEMDRRKTPRKADAA